MTVKIISIPYHLELQYLPEFNKVSLETYGTVVMLRGAEVDISEVCEDNGELAIEWFAYVWLSVLHSHATIQIKHFILTLLCCWMRQERRLLSPFAVDISLLERLCQWRRRNGELMSMIQPDKALISARSLAFVLNIFEPFVVVVEDIWTQTNKANDPD